MKSDTYTNGYIIQYPEGDKSLQRKRIVHQEDLNDRAYTIKDGDKLTTLSYRFYGNPLLWFLIADANEIDNPFELTTGTNIIIPNQNIYDI